MNNELTRNMYRLQSFANPLVFNSLAKKKVYILHCHLQYFIQFCNRLDTSLRKKGT